MPLNPFCGKIVTVVPLGILECRRPRMRIRLCGSDLDRTNYRRLSVGKRTEGPRPHRRPVPVIDDQQVDIIERRLGNDHAVILILFLVGSVKEVNVEPPDCRKIDAAEIGFNEGEIDNFGLDNVDIV
jgi:hypothetical protein